MKLFDGLQNLVSGLGVFGRDKATGGTFVFHQIGRHELDAAYRGDWIAAKIVDIPPHDMTREWRSWQADKKQITAIEAEEKRLGVRAKVKKAIWWARLYGGSALILHDGASDLTTPLNVTASGGLKRILVVNRFKLTPGEIQWDPNQDGYDEPMWFELSTPTSGPVRIDPSRVITFGGNPLPDPESASVEGKTWGDSVLQRVRDAVQHAIATNQGIASLIEEAKVDIIKMPGLMTKIGTQEEEDRIVKRYSLAATLKSINNVLLLDGAEEWERKEMNFGSLADLQMNFLQIVSGAADIPATRFLQQSPKGMNATGESDLQMHYDNMSSMQETELQPRLDRLDDALIVSALGTRPIEVFFVFRPLRKMSPKEKQEIENGMATTAKTIADSGLVPTAALEVGFQNKLIEAGVYPGLEKAIEEAKAGTLLPFEDPADQGGADPITGEPLDPSQTARPGAKGGNPKAANENGHEVTINGPGGLSIKAKTKTARRDWMADATPRPLYVSRKVLNADQIIRWAKAQGFETTLTADDLHVTVAYSRTPIDWMKCGSDWSGDEHGVVTVPAGGPRIVEKLGDKGAVVLLFTSDALNYRHNRIKADGASWDFEGYTPHITLTYSGDKVDLTAVEAFQGPIRLGPEIFESLDLNWKETVVEVTA
jgi:phage-related protein (TIGR01555 family)